MVQSITNTGLENTFRGTKNFKIKSNLLLKEGNVLVNLKVNLEINFLIQLRFAHLKITRKSLDKKCTSIIRLEKKLAKLYCTWFDTIHNVSLLENKSSDGS